MITLTVSPTLAALAAIITWIVAHKIAVWAIVTSLASLAYTRLDQNTKWHAFFATLASVGIDIPRFLEKVSGKRNNGGSTGAGGGGIGVVTIDTNHFRGIRDTIDRWRRAFACCLAAFIFVIMTLAFGFTVSGCANGPQLPPNTPTDVTNAIGCVLPRLLSGQDVAPCIVEYGPALIADAIQTLLDSTDFQKQPDAIIANAKAQLVNARAKAAQ